MEKILVTGGAGFIGSNFVHYVHRERPDYHITVLDAMTYAANPRSLRGLEDERFTFYRGDVRNRSVVDRLVKASDAVIHFAAESHVDNSIAAPRLSLKTNVFGTFEVLEAVRKYDKRLHHISTDEVYGDLDLADPERFTEASAYDPSSPYSATKAASDHLVRAWVRSYGLAATISNCSNNYGPYQHVEKMIPRQITNILCGEKLKLYGSGENIRDWIHAEDHSSAILTILEKGQIGETYLVGADSEKSNHEVFNLILELMGKDESWLEHVKDRPGHDMRYAIDATKIRRNLKWRPKYTDFREGLIQTIAWYTENRDWWRGQKAKTEAKYRRIES